MTRPPFPFVVGVARSGTTLVRLILNEHPELAIPPESYFPVALWSRRRRYERGSGFDLGRFAQDLLTDRDWRVRQVRETWGIAPDVMRTRLSGVEPIDYAEAVRRVYGLYAEVHGKPRYGDKTPAFVARIPMLAGMFPEARFVHLVRDGRDVAASLVEMRFGARTIGAAAATWADGMRRGRAGCAATGRCLEVRYEELVRDPEETLRRICAFVDLDFRPQLLEFHERAAAVLAAEAVPAENVRSLSRPVAAGIRDWRRDMAPRDVALVEAVAGATLSDAGYAPSGRVPDGTVRLLGSAERLRFAVVEGARAAWRRVRDGSVPAGGGR